MRARRLTLALVAGTAALGFLPLASAAAPVAVAPTVESWFQPNPSCTTPAGCLAAPGAPTAVTVFPAGTLHVGVSGGQETARTYLGLPAGALAGLSAASLSVPLDVDPASGTAAPETAKVQVCLTTQPLARVEGSFADPPETDCARSAPVSYIATPQPRLEADLGGLLEGLSTATGLVLLPDAESVTPADAWRTVFSSRTRTGATPPAVLTVQRAGASVAAPAPAPAEAPAAEAPVPVDLEPELGGAPVPELLDAVPDVVALEAPGELPAQAPPTAPEQVVPVQEVGFPETVLVGYAYPGVWLLPLGMLVVVPLVARTLTRDLTPVRVREQ